MSRLKSYLQDELLGALYEDIRSAGPLKSISVDVTHKCNLRCTGCYYFAEGMDRRSAPGDDAAFDDFLDRETARGTNFITIVGGEPALVPDRLRKIHARFHTNVASNCLWNKIYW